jgi:hypothetical protein
MGGPTEPSADLREAASGLWQMFVALTNEGFDERQALIIIGHVLAAGQGGGS